MQFMQQLLESKRQNFPEAQKFEKQKKPNSNANKFDCISVLFVFMKCYWTAVATLNICFVMAQKWDNPEKKNRLV